MSDNRSASRSHRVVAEDDELWAEVSPHAARRLLLAALNSFSERGYHGTSTRHISSGAGMSPGAVYIHYRTKSELLGRIIAIYHEHLEQALAGAVTNITTPAARLRALVALLAAWHARHRKTALVIQRELGALEPDQYKLIREARLRMYEQFIAEIQSGAKAGEFDVADIDGTCEAIVAVCLGVANWYRPDNPRSPEEVGALSAHLAARMVGAR